METEENKMEEKRDERQSCPYCMEGELVAKFGIKICELEHSKVYLFREQSHTGRVIVACKEHVREIADLSDADRNDFMADVIRVSRAVNKTFHPDKMNYGMYSDTLHHLHVHLVPKYRDGYEWGGVFAMNPGETLLSDAEYEEIIEAIKANL